MLFFLLAALQSLSGSFVRIADAGLAMPSFSMSGDGLLPPLTDDGLEAVNRQRADIGLGATEFSDVWLHFFHRLGGVFLLCGAALLWWQTSGERIAVRGLTLIKASRAALLLMLLCLLEGIVGLFLLWSLLDPLALGLHMVMSAFILRQALSIWLYARTGL
jgi:heme A synthase